jgi:hypothetical protein
MEPVCYDILSKMNLPGMILISLEDFEKGDEALLSAKKNRSKVEYYFTCTPSLPLFVMASFPKLEGITYLDADIFFFNDPSPVFQEIGSHSIALIPHRFEQRFQYMEKRGIYNVGFLYFRHNATGLGFLRWWRNECLQWCYDRLEEGRFADQKYLDRIPELFEGVTIVQHKGANLAPWNLANYSIVDDGSAVWVDDQPLLFYHFHGLKQLTRWLYDPNLMVFKAHLTKPIKKGVYQPYLETLSSLASKTAIPRRSDALHAGIRYQFENAHPFTRQWARFNQSLAVARVIVNHRFIMWMRGRAF